MFACSCRFASYKDCPPVNTSDARCIPVMAGFFNASCDKAMFGWPCDETIEKFRDQFAKESDPAKQKQIVEDLQKYWVDHPTHANVGQWYAPIARRNNIEGNMIAPVTVFWNVTKK